MIGNRFLERYFQGPFNKQDDLLEIKCQIFYNVKQLVIDENEVQDKMLECAICKQLLIDPKECTVCQNSFCFECICQWLKEKASCPFRCQQPYFRECHRVIRNHLDTLILKCPNHSKGCSKLIQQQQLGSHLKNECEFYSVQCKNTGCQQIMHRAQVNQHAQTCIYRLIYCEICKQRFKYYPNHNCLDKANEIISKYKAKCQSQQKQLEKLYQIINNQEKEITQFKQEARKSKYQCEKKHQLKWQSLLKGICKRCEATNQTAIIRTECKECQEKYCIKCMPVYIFNDKCPNGHEFERVTNADFCEICFKQDKFNGWKDFFCDIDICDECYDNIDL